MNHELNDLRRQMRGDFEFTCAALKAQSESVTSGFKDLAQRMEIMGAEFAERQRQVEGRLRLMDHRFDAMLTSIMAEQSQFARKSDLDSLTDRVGQLEGQKQPPAA